MSGAGILALWGSLTPAAAGTGQFEVLGTPVKSTLISAMAAGVDERGQDALYFSCAQPGSRLFLLQANPETGAARQWPAPAGEGAWAIAIGPDHCVYLGTWEDGRLLKFDPAHPDRGLEDLGKPSASESYIWELAAGKDGKLYGCTYPHAKLVRYDPKSGRSEDLGRLDPGEMYARCIAVSSNGMVYVGIGSVRAQVASFDPETGQTRAMLEADQRPTGFAHVFRGADGQVYASAGRKAFLCDKDALRPMKSLPAPARPVLRDGRALLEASVQGGDIVYQLEDRAGNKVRQTVRFTGVGVGLFAAGAGPGGRVYGSTALPLELFDYDPASRELRDLGNPTDVNGEIYSFAQDGKRLYVCAYPGSFLSVYDPAQPWHYGRTKESNPRGLGPMGDGHLRPRAMALDPAGRVYVGSLPPYGQTGGALGVYDPAAGAVTENYRHIVTNQGISALCFEPQTGRLFAGSSIGAGGGAAPVAKECVVFAWDTKKRCKEWEEVIVKGDAGVGALVAARGKVFGVTMPSSTLFVVDSKTLAVLSRARIPFGGFHEISLGYDAQHDRIYGLAGSSVFSLEPDSYAMAEVGRSPEPITCGFALTETGIYFGSGTRLVRWKWD